MTDPREKLIRYKLSRAEETLEEAAVMLRTGHPYGAANRLYYACFYAVTALLLTGNLSSSRHKKPSDSQTITSLCLNCSTK